MRRDELRVAPERTAVDFGGYAAHVVAVDVARLDGKVAFITGAGGAIAGAIARRFATEGAAVMCVDINADAAARTVGSIASAGGRAIAQRCDVSNAADVKAAIDAAAEAFSRIDVLVSTAANSEPLGTTLELDEAKWNETPAVNLTGAFLVCKYGIPRLIEAGGGSMPLWLSHKPDDFATISSGLYRFLAIAILLDVKHIPQVGPLQWGWIILQA